VGDTDMPIRVNKVVQTADTSSSSVGSGGTFDANESWTIGYLNDTADRFFAGSIAFIAVWDRVLSDDDILAVENYAVSRYNLSV